MNRQAIAGVANPVLSEQGLRKELKVKQGVMKSRSVAAREGRQFTAFAVLGPAVLLAALLAASPTQAAKTTLTFISWQFEEAGFGEWWGEAIAAFEKVNPDVRIKKKSMARKHYVERVLTSLVEGTPPDIVHLASFEYYAFAEDGWLEDLGPWIEESALDLEGWAGQQACQWRNATYCIMLLYFGNVMFYNEALFEEAGVSVPTSWEEFLDAARKLTRDTDGDGRIDQFGVAHQTAAGGTDYLSQALNYVLGAGGRWTDSSGKVTVDSPGTIEGLRRWKQLFGEGLAEHGLTLDEVSRNFLDGKVAMWIDGPWRYGNLSQAAPDVRARLKIARPPFSPPLGGGSNVIGMSSEKSLRRRKLVWKFIEHITSLEWQQKYSELAGLAAPHPRSATDAARAAVPHFDLLVETRDLASKAGVDRTPRGLEVKYDSFAAIVMEALERMIAEDLDPAAVAKTLQRRAENL